MKEGPFVVMKMLSCTDAGDRNFQIVIAEPGGGALIVFSGLLEEQANDFCDRLNNAVQSWLRGEEVLQQ